MTICTKKHTVMVKWLSGWGFIFGCEEESMLAAHVDDGVGHGLVCARIMTGAWSNLQAQHMETIKRNIQLLLSHTGDGITTVIYHNWCERILSSSTAD